MDGAGEMIIETLDWDAFGETVFTVVEEELPDIELPTSGPTPSIKARHVVDGFEMGWSGRHRWRRDRAPGLDTILEGAE
jgi:hypothetical protein